jgi:hypothetical protein
MAQRVAIVAAIVVAVVVAIVADIVVIVVDIAVVADNNNRAGAIAPYIVEGPLDDSIDTVEVPVAVDSIDTGFVDRVNRVDNRVA